MHRPLISVIVPVYNSEKSLERCVESILNQTYSNLQIILVDDGSKDNSLSLCKMFQAKDSRVLVVHKENGGVSSARNIGINHATGDYVTFVDSDDWIDAEAYGFLIDMIKEQEADVLIHPLIFEFPEKECIYQDTGDIIVYNQKDAIDAMMQGDRFAGHVHNKLFRRDLFAVNDFDEDIHIYEDVLTMLKILLRSKKIVFVDKHMYHYVMFEDSLMHQSFNSKCLTGRIAASRITSMLVNVYPEKAKFADLMNIRINYHICNSAYSAKLKSNDIFITEFMQFKSVVDSCYTKAVRMLCSQREKIAFDIVKTGLLPYMLYGFMRKIYRAIACR